MQWAKRRGGAAFNGNKESAVNVDKLILKLEIVLCIWNFFSSEIVKSFDLIAMGRQSFFLYCWPVKNKKKFPEPAFKKKKKLAVKIDSKMI